MTRGADRLASLLTVLALAVPGIVSAQGGRAVLLGPPAADVRARVEGQTADLPYELAHADADVAALDFERGLAAGEGAGAGVVLWLVEREEAIDVHVVEVAERRLLVRRIPVDGEGPLARSAAIEAAALVVRSAMQSLAAGGHIGVVVPPPARSEAPAAEPPPAPESGVPDGVPREPVRGPALWMQAGWTVAVDGSARLGQHAPQALVGVEVEWLRVGASFAAGLPVELEDERTRLVVLRLRPALAARFVVADASPVRLAVGADVGAALWHRTTAVRSTDLVATEPSWSVSPLIGAAADLELWLADPLAILVGLGADWLPGAPTFAYDTGGEREERNALWQVQPWASISLVVLTR